MAARTAARFPTSERRPPSIASECVRTEEEEDNDDGPMPAFSRLVLTVFPTLNLMPNAISIEYSMKTEETVLTCSCRVSSATTLVPSALDDVDWAATVEATAIAIAKLGGMSAKNPSTGQRSHDGVCAVRAVRNAIATHTSTVASVTSTCSTGDVLTTPKDT